MSHNPTALAGTLWTIGHSNHPLETFLDLLRRQQIEILVDVRSSPYSRYASQFNREVIAAAVEGCGIHYLFLGDQLGGRAANAQFYDDQGHVLYDRVAQSAGFQQGVQRLMQVAARARTAIFCGEEDPTDCHRRLLVGRVLGQSGIDVFHIRGDGRLQSEDELAAEALFRKTKGQMSLFETEDQTEWKSTQSVLPRKTPRSSSAPSGEPPYGD